MQGEHWILIANSCHELYFANSRHKIYFADSLGGQKKQFPQAAVQADDATATTIPYQRLRFLHDIFISSSSDKKKLPEFTT